MDAAGEVWLKCQSGSDRDEARKGVRVNEGRKPFDEEIWALKERAKELDCLYAVDDVLSREGLSEHERFREVVQVIPDGWQYPSVCGAVLVVDDVAYRTKERPEGEWFLRAPIKVDGEKAGELSVHYVAEQPASDEGPFLSEERRLIDTLADRIGRYLAARNAPAPSAGESTERQAAQLSNWRTVLSFIAASDPVLVMRLTRRMVNYLCWHGWCNEELMAAVAASNTGRLTERTGAGEEVAEVDEEAGSALASDSKPKVTGERPASDPSAKLAALAERAFATAAAQLGDEEVSIRLQSWIVEDKARPLLTTLTNVETTLADIMSALSRFRQYVPDESELPSAVQTALRVGLLRRIFRDQIEFTNTAKDHVRIRDFYGLLDRVALFPLCHGKLGGKSAGLFVAQQITKRSSVGEELLSSIKVPKTWYVPSDVLLDFITSNDLDDIYKWKYLEIDEVRGMYESIERLFVGSSFPPTITQALAAALDDFGNTPLIVRSSSLLEDQTGSSFAGKYKSVFVPNRGPKSERLAALEHAIAEVYASVFAPDPIQYRAERGLLAFHEEMGIMIQEVVGRRVGKWYLPAYAGVAFSVNEHRWSPRIQPSDGLVRLVPGLGTRAVDRFTDDYPVLVAPGQPGLRVNTTPDEVVRYSPQLIEVIDLEANQLVALPVRELLEKHGNEYPIIGNIVSRIDDGILRKPRGLGPDFEEEEHVVTFEGLISDTPFVDQMGAMLKVLEEALGTPVDVEFACDGENLYLLQCRAQSSSRATAPAAIPRNLPSQQVLFSANRHISNGAVCGITHIVYVDPDEYRRLSDRGLMLSVGRAVGKLNKLLPKNQFVLMGPGRWGSRGDIRLGVSVSYSDINNTAMLIEIARREGGYVPELSFGTHFFQDLVEAGIRYLPLYPDEAGASFRESFFRRSDNLLSSYLPEQAELASVLRVIDVERETDGEVLNILMNAELEEAVGFLADPAEVMAEEAPSAEGLPEYPKEHWRWRLQMAEQIAAEIDAECLGVKRLFVFGSTKNGTAGPASDIDLLVLFDGSDQQRHDLETWLDGWSQALAELNYLRTGYRTDGLLDLHIITDDDIERRTSYAVKIEAITDPARELELGQDGCSSCS